MYSGLAFEQEEGQWCCISCLLYYSAFYHVYLYKNSHHKVTFQLTSVLKCLAFQRNAVKETTRDYLQMSTNSDSRFAQMNCCTMVNFVISVA